MLAGDEMEDTVLKLGKYEFNSRLFVGTGKYQTFDIMKEALEASGSEENLLKYKGILEMPVGRRSLKKQRESPLRI